MGDGWSTGNPFVRLEYPSRDEVKKPRRKRKSVKKKKKTKSYTQAELDEAIADTWRAAMYEVSKCAARAAEEPYDYWSMAGLFEDFRGNADNYRLPDIWHISGTRNKKVTNKEYKARLKKMGKK